MKKKCSTGTKFPNKNDFLSNLGIPCDKAIKCGNEWQGAIRCDKNSAEWELIFKLPNDNYFLSHVEVGYDEVWKGVKMIDKMWQKKLKPGN